MNNTTTKRSIKNVFASLISQVIILGLSFVLPRLIISNFSSQVNGFFSTVNQIYSYLEVLRAGVGAAAIHALYRPIIDKNRNEISKIVSTAREYFQKGGIVYLTCSFIIAVVLVFVGEPGIPRIEVFLIVIIQGISGWISFSLISWFVDLLRAEGKNYVFIVFQMSAKILTQALEVVLIITTKSPLLVKSATLLLSFLQLMLFVLYRKRFYRDYDFKGETDNSLLKDRKSYLVFHISSLICTNTDIVVLSIFCGYQIASVYSIYYLIVSGVNMIANAVYSGTSFVLGHSYQKNLELFSRTHDLYNFAYTSLVTSLFSVCYILMLPFVKLYTNGIADVEYVYDYLPVFFCVIQILTCSKNVGDITNNLGGCANKVSWRAIVEALINIVVSVVSVLYLGIYGVLIGTITALLYRSVDDIIFSNKNVLHRKPLKDFYVFITNILLFGVIVLAKSRINIEVSSYFQFLMYAVITSIIVFSFVFLVNGLLNARETKELSVLIKKKISIRRDESNSSQNPRET